MAILSAIGSLTCCLPFAPKPHCCLSNGNLWDFAGVYSKDAIRQDSPPKPVFGDGPVANVQPALRRTLTALLGGSSDRSIPPRETCSKAELLIFPNFRF